MPGRPAPEPPRPAAAVRRRSSSTRCSDQSSSPTAASASPARASASAGVRPPSSSGTTMFSYAVRTAARPLPCGTITTPRAAASGRSPTGEPSMLTLPRCGHQHARHQPQQRGLPRHPTDRSRPAAWPAETVSDSGATATRPPYLISTAASVSPLMSGPPRPAGGTTPSWSSRRTSVPGENHWSACAGHQNAIIPQPRHDAGGKLGAALRAVAPATDRDVDLRPRSPDRRLQSGLEDGQVEPHRALESVVARDDSPPDDVAARAAHHDHHVRTRPADSAASRSLEPRSAGSR